MKSVAGQVIVTGTIVITATLDTFLVSLSHTCHTCHADPLEKLDPIETFVLTSTSKWQFIGLLWSGCRLPSRRLGSA